MNRIKTTTTSTGTGNIAVSATPAARCRPLSDIAAGKIVRMLIEDEAGTDWELVNATIIDATSFSRGTVINGSAGPGVKVNFGAGTKTVFVAAVLVDPSIPFNATIPLDRPEIAYMAAYTMTGPLTLTAGANPVDGAHVVATIIGDGTNDLVISGAVKHASSLPFNKTAGAKNLAQFLRTPGVTRYAISQAAADVVVTAPSTPADTTSPTLSSPTSASTGTTTGSGAVTTNEGNGTLYWLASINATESVATVKAGSSVAVTSTGSKAVAVASLAAGTLYYLHFVHTDAAGNDSSRVTSASFTTASAGDTTAPTLTSPTGTQTGETTASGSVSTNEANGTLYRMVSANAVESAATVKAANLTSAVTATGVQNVTFTGLTASTQYYAHYVHRDAAGNDSTVANSTGFTTAAVPSVTYETLGEFTGVVANGTTPEVYHGNGTATQDYMEGGATLTKKFAANTDGAVIIETIGAGNTDWTLGATSAATPSNAFGQCTMGIRNAYATTLPYSKLLGNAGLVYAGTPTTTNSLTPADGDRVKMERINSSGGGNTATMIYSVARAATPNTFVEVFRATNFPCEALRVRWYVIGSPYVTKIVSTGLVP